MKTIAMDRDYQFKFSETSHRQYVSGMTYQRVPEVQARAIVAAGAGRVVNE